MKSYNFLIKKKHLELKNEIKIIIQNVVNFLFNSLLYIIDKKN